MCSPYLWSASCGGDDDLLCGCGHRSAEHSAFGACHGCNDCGDDVDIDGDSARDHALRRCGCDGFVDVAAFDWTALIGSS